MFLLNTEVGSLGQQLRVLAARRAFGNFVSSTNMAAHNTLLSVTTEGSNILFWPPQALHICCKQTDRQNTHMHKNYQKIIKVGIRLRAELPLLWFCLPIIVS